ncbi:phosphatase PAP2 family protein [Gordonia sp. (in: high G+C Gram-positive bacteria)]|uniref:phosphatase PAP2 family protein n=1 Tax=Gordonia sp. (in: high G+C Gram-positive bacteria) TaxID=84139 RepID=UPI0039E3B18B
MSLVHLAASIPLATPPIDIGVLDLAVGSRSGFWTSVAESLSWLGSTKVLTVIVVVAAVAFAAFRQWRSAAMVLFGSWIAYWLMLLLKRVIDRDRPPVGERLAHAAYQSMPSGHAMMSTIVFCLIAVALYRSSERIRRHPDILMLAPILAAAIGVSRLYLGVHWTTDVVVGWLLGAIWVTIAAAVADLGRTRTPVAAA